MVEVRNFQSKTEIVLESTNLYELWSKMCEQVLENTAVFQMNASGWTFHSIVSVEIHTVRFRPWRGGSWVLSPKFFAHKKALVNMKSDKIDIKDDQCFKWCIARALNPVERNPDRIIKILKIQAQSLNFTGIEFPACLKDINKIEKNNSEIAVNVLGYGKQNVFSLGISEINRKTTVNLFDPCQQFVKTFVKSNFMS